MGQQGDENPHPYGEYGRGRAGWMQRRQITVGVLPVANPACPSKDFK